MPSDQTDRMSIPPDGYAAMAVAGAILLQWLLPLSLLPPFAWSNPTLFVGLALALAGLALEFLAARALVGGGTSPRPNDAPGAFVSNGPYRWSRNPFYLGMLLLMTGLMLAASLDWVVLFVPLLWLALDRFVIPVEERRLERAFGQAYLNFAASTRRWL